MLKVVLRRVTGVDKICKHRGWIAIIVKRNQLHAQVSQDTNSASVASVEVLEFFELSIAFVGGATSEET